jgi:hypothetical protein
MKKNLILLLALMSISTSTWAVSKEYFGYLKSGDGLCSVAFEEQSWAYHYVDFKTRDYTVKAANVTLQKGQLTTHNEVFDKEGDDYEQLAFGFPLPKTYQIELKYLGKGQFAIKKTRLFFSQPTITKRDVCITK